MRVKIFVGESASAREAAAQAEQQANTFLSENTISWQEAKGQHTNAYAVTREKSGEQHYFVLTLILEEKATRFL